MPVESIEISRVTKRIVWFYPYKRLASHPVMLGCKDGDRSWSYPESRAMITNGFREKKLFDCRRGLWGVFLDEKDDPSEAITYVVSHHNTIAEDQYLRVCYAVMHEVAYLPKQPGEQQPAAPPPTTVERKPPSVQLGTGFFIGEDGTVLTNAHVVEGCSEARIGQPGRGMAARVIARDGVNDLALLRSTARPSAVATLRLSVRQGEAVAAYGFPLPGLLASGGNLTTGNITALSGIGDDSRLLQISTPVQPGNSGGPLLDGSGNVVGIVEGKLDAIKVATAIGDIPQNINFAIKASVVATFLDSNGVHYATGQPGAARSPADIAEAARRFTVPVECGGSAQ